MCPHQPALNERRDTVYAWQNFVGILARATDGGSMMNIFVFCGAWIGRKPVSVNTRARFDMRLNKYLERFSFGVGDNLQAAAPKTFGGKQFNCDRHQYLAFGAAPALAVPHASKNRLIHFNVSRQHVVSSVADGTPKPVQHRPSRRVRAKPENSMKRFGGDAIFSGCHVPCGREPDGQRRSGMVKDRACGGGRALARINLTS